MGFAVIYLFLASTSQPEGDTNPGFKYSSVEVQLVPQA